MKRMKKWLAALLALAMLLSLAACNPSGSEESDAPSTEDPEGSAQVVQDYGLEELGSGDVKWKEETTSDGWVKITNDGGATLGYSKESGVQLLQSGGYAFKDLNRNGALDPYEDWRLDADTRARDLVDQMTSDQIVPYLTHGGWGTFTTDKKIYTSGDNSGYAYLLGGGRAGLTRSVGSTNAENADHAKWVNIIQELCESQPLGIPGLTSIDPNTQSNIVQCLALAATFSPETAFEVGKAYSKQYRAMGVNILLGPQVDVMSTPVMDRSAGTYGEDPALSRDIAEAFISGLQSTYSDSGEDLGWGADSVMAVVKHYVGGGADEQGGDDHNNPGKYSTFPNNNYEAHLIPFHDGAFNLTHSSTGSVAGLMTAYTATYSPDGSLGDTTVGSAWSQFKYDTLKEAGWSGCIISDWTIFADVSARGVSWGMEDYSEAERLAKGLEMGMCQAGGYSDLDKMADAWDILCDDLGEDDALALIRDRAFEVAKVTVELGMFENPYCSTEYAREVCTTTESLAYGLETQLDGIVMVKNSGGLIKQSDGGDKPTAYIPYVFVPEVGGMFAAPAKLVPSVDLDLAAEYYNVVTDTVGDPSGTDKDGKAAYTPNDIIRASAADIAACDVCLVAMTGPHTGFASVSDEDGNIVAWTPPSIQYGEYTAVGAREVSIAGDLVTISFNDGYTQQTEIRTENRSYNGQTASQDKNYSHLETLRYVANSAGSTPVVVLMNMTACASMVWSEVEPLADAILVGYSATDEAFLKTVAGEHEPSGLLVAQMPASMAAVEAQTGEDVPRDVECYVDSDGNVYDFAFGLNWSGKIDDQRVKTYSVAPLTECSSFDFHYAN